LLRRRSVWSSVSKKASTGKHTFLNSISEGAFTCPSSEVSALDSAASGVWRRRGRRALHVAGAALRAYDFMRVRQVNVRARSFAVRRHPREQRGLHSVLSETELEHWRLVMVSDGHNVQRAARGLLHSWLVDALHTL